MFIKLKAEQVGFNFQCSYKVTLLQAMLQVKIVCKNQ